MADINYLQGTGAVNATLNVPAPKPIGLSVVTSPGATTGSAVPSLQGNTNGTAVPGVYQASAPTYLGSPAAPATPKLAQPTVTKPAASVFPTTQTYTWGDGSVTDAQGNKISGANSGTPGNGQYQASTQDVQSANLASANIPGVGQNSAAVADVSPTTDTNTLTNTPTTRNDVLALYQSNLNRSQDLFNSIASFYNNPITPGMQSAFNTLNSTQSQIEQNTASLQNETQGYYDTAGGPGATKFAAGNAAAEANRQYQYVQNTLGIQQANALRTLQFQQSSQQQKLDAANTLYQINSNDLNNSLNFYKATAPQAIGQPIVDANGQAHLPIMNPITGQVTVTDLGNVGPVAQNISVQKIGQHFDPNVGQMIDDYGTVNQSTHTVTPISGGQFGGTSGSGSSGATYGLMPDGSSVQFTPSGTARTDRNNNPIAASVALNSDGSLNTNDSTSSQWTQALTQAGVPYQIEKGANFGDRATIQFPNAAAGQAGAETLLGTSAFSWYKNHTGTEALAGINSPQQFNALSSSQKAAVVDGIYKQEGGGHNSWSQLASQSSNAQLASSQSIGGTQNSELFNQVKAALPSIIQQGLRQLPDGTLYIDKGTLAGSGTGANVMADTWASKLSAQGVPIHSLSADDAQALNDITTTTYQLQNTVGLFAKIAESGAVSAVGRNITDPFAKFFSTDRGNNVKTYESNKDSLFRQINTLAGSHPRINSLELANTSQALPQWSEFSHDTLAQGLSKITQTQSYLDSAIKAIIPSYVGTPLNINGQFIVRAPDSQIYTFNDQQSAQTFMANTHG